MPKPPELARTLDHIANIGLHHDAMHDEELIKAHRLECIHYGRKVEPVYEEGKEISKWKTGDLVLWLSSKDQTVCLTEEDICKLRQMLPMFDPPTPEEEAAWERSIFGHRRNLLP